jgi:carbon-monoxide dehydrogenase medium subunit
MAGGVGLVAFMKERLLRPKYVVSLSGINELKTLELGDKGLSVGAGVHLSELENDAIRRAYPTLYFAVRSIADPIIRNMGTLIGDVLEALPWGTPILLSFR